MIAWQGWWRCQATIYPPKETNSPQQWSFAYMPDRALTAVLAMESLL